MVGAMAAADGNPGPTRRDGAGMVGREREAAALVGFISGRGGERALVLTGEAGMGKTTLWQEGLLTDEPLPS